MKQLTQKLKDGAMQVIEVPPPLLERGMVLIKNHYSVISPGTEGSTVKAARESLIGKAKERPEQVKQVIETLRQQGPLQTYRTVMKKLDSYSPLGYSSAGEVVDVAPDVKGFSVGDLVACGGGGYASHAEIVAVHVNLCVKLHENADLKKAAYNTLGAIALQGIRQADPKIGEICAVIGLGLLGQITVQLLKASGCKVIGSDLDQKKIGLASQMGCDVALQADELINQAKSFSHGNGVDSVIITASTKTSEPIENAAEICRFGGKIVLVGVCDIQIPRQIFWEKEIEFKVSKAGGAGIFDPIYEIEGIDYPIGLVRWTERRNLEVVLDLMKEKKLRMEPLITHRFDISKAQIAYETLMKREGNFIGVLLGYPERNGEKVNVLKPQPYTLKPKQKYLKFPSLYPPPSMGEGAGRGGQSMFGPPSPSSPPTVGRGVSTVDF
jgi:threonine dehydrogenase-like Zn-dependent dehydrogenase